MKVEKINYTHSKDFKCPHCGGSDNVNIKDELVCQYETPNNKKWMRENVGYQWTEDRKCKKCGEMYSLINGC